MTRTMKFLAIVLLAAMSINAKDALAQNFRYDYIATTTTGAGQAVPLLALPGVGVTFFTCSSGICTTLASTYASASSVTPCPTNAQVVQSMSSTCVSTADFQGNFGAWFLPGQYAYTFTISGQPYGPYPFTIGGAGGQGSGTVGGGTGGQLAQYPSSGTTVGGVTISGDATVAIGGALMLATVNTSPGSCGDATHIAQITVNGKGLTTACNPVAIDFPAGGPTLQTGGLNNASQTVLNLQSGPGITVTNTSGGNIFFSASGSTAPAGGNFALQYANGSALGGANFAGIVMNNGATAPPTAATQAQLWSAIGGQPCFQAGSCSLVNIVDTALTIGQVVVVGNGQLLANGGTLGSSAFVNIGTSGPNVPLMNGTNTWSGFNNFTAGVGAAAYSGTGTDTFTLGSSTVVGSGAGTPNCNVSICDSVSGDVAFLTGTGISAGGLAVTVGLPVARSGSGSLVCLAQIQNGASLPQTSCALGAGNTIDIFVQTPLPDNTTINFSYVVFGKL